MKSRLMKMKRRVSRPCIPAVSLLQARGWTDEYLAKHFVVVYANYYVEYDHTKTFMDDGQTQQYFLLDPGHGNRGMDDQQHLAGYKLGLQCCVGIWAPAPNSPHFH